MQLFNPAGLWLAGIIPLIIIMYLLKKRYQERVISSHYLWDQVIRDMEANRPWQRLKKNLLLFLQLLVACLLVMAVSRPYLPVITTANQHIIVVMDCSASMMATDVYPTRLGAAKKQVLEVINQLGKNDQMTIIAMGEQPRVLVSASQDKPKLQQALQGMLANTGSAALEPTLALLASLTEKKPDTAVLIYSDGRTLAVNNRLELNCPIEFRSIGHSADNMSIGTLASRRDGNKIVILARVHNFGEQTVTSDLILRMDDQLLDVRSVTLKAGEIRDIIWEELPLSVNQGVLEASLTRPDIFAADNQVYALMDRSQISRVLLVSKGNIFLEKAINLAPDIELYKTRPEDYDPNIQDYQCYIFDGYVPSRLPQANTMILNPPVNNGFISVSGQIKDIRELSSLREDPLLHYVDINDWQLARSQKLACPPGCRSVLDYKGMPLLIAGELSGNRSAIFAFDLHDSNIPLQTGFPILISNLQDWLLPKADKSMILDASQDYFQLSSLPSEGKLTIKNPEGKQSDYLPPYPPVFPAQSPGLYQVALEQEANSVESFSVIKGVSSFESNLKPGKLPWKYSDNTENIDKKRLTNRELWIFLAWAGLILVLMEWEVYRRGY